MAAAASGPRRAAPEWDEQIRWRLARGEETALGELYDRFAPLVHGLAGCILDDRKAAQQLTREVFAQLWEHPESFDPAQGSLRSWLGALTRRRALDRLRLLHTDDHELQERAGAARTQYVVESLPDPLRETLAVTYFDGRTYQETAARLGISEQDAKQRIRLGLQLLAGALGRGEGAEIGADWSPDGDAAGYERGDSRGGGAAGSAVARERAGRTEPARPDAGRTGADPACPARAHAERRRTDAAGAST
ncbi:sigma-70 family RNA polymerase sigma factor [Kitasatospora sp. NPDC056138]|uniref:sigma-70 family RNA polymerase sigma factor n=1 Tax=Kitasatospora sp. NPDC056138 TaxID=3345724 RepID=UPI0035E2CB20